MVKLNLHKFGIFLILIYILVVANIKKKRIFKLHIFIDADRTLNHNYAKQTSESSLIIFIKSVDINCKAPSNNIFSIIFKIKEDF